MRHAGRDQSLPGKFDGAEFVRKTIMEQEKNRNIFETMPVPQAVRIMALPTIISQLIILIYNMADTFYLGRTNNPYMVAGDGGHPDSDAVGLCIFQLSQEIGRGGLTRGLFVSGVI